MPRKPNLPRLITMVVNAQIVGNPGQVNKVTTAIQVDRCRALALLPGLPLLCLPCSAQPRAADDRCARRRLAR